jgi:hypothetical protein
MVAASKRFAEFEDSVMDRASACRSNTCPDTKTAEQLRQIHGLFNDQELRTFHDLLAEIMNIFM